jgi:hypothetical protein
MRKTQSSVQAARKENKVPATIYSETGEPEDEENTTSNY